MVTRDILDETLVVPIRAGAADLNALFVFNATAACLWRHLDGSRTVEDLADVLCAGFAVEREVALEDVKDFLASLEQAGLTEGGLSDDGPT